MAVDIKAGKLTECLVAINKIIEASDDSNNSIPFEISYWSLRVAKKLKAEEEIFLKQRDKLLEKYADKVLDDNGIFTGQYKFTDKERTEKFNEEIKQLSDTDLKIEGISTKPFTAFGTNFKKIYSSLKVLLDVLVTDTVENKE